MRIGKMIKFWKYYKYYFCTLWKRPLVWLLTGGMIYAQYEKEWQIQAMIIVGFVLLLPLAVACERVRADYELEDIACALADREARRAAKAAPASPDATIPEAEKKVGQEPYDWASTDGGFPETLGEDHREPDDLEAD